MGASAPVNLNGQGLPEPALIVALVKSATGELMTIPLANVDLGNGTAALKVTLVDQSGNAVSAGSGSGSSANTSSAGNITAVPAATASTALIAANAARKDLTIYNDSNSAMYVATAANATTTAYSEKVPANSLYELPIDYTGPISAVWDTATGNARITEYV